MLLNKNEILSADDRQTLDIEIPEWGGTVRITVMSGTSRDAYEASLVKMQDDGSGNGRTAERDLTNLRSKLVAACMIDEQGKQLFSVAEVEQLGSKNGAVLNRIYEEANNLNATTEDKIEEVAKN